MRCLTTKVYLFNELAVAYYHRRTEETHPCTVALERRDTTEVLYLGVSGLADVPERVPTPQQSSPFYVLFVPYRA